MWNTFFPFPIRPWGGEGLPGDDGGSDFDGGVGDGGG